MDQELQDMERAQYKKYIEDFMANNPGSSAVHTFLSIFFTVQCSIFCSLSNKNNLGPGQYLYEYIVIVLSLILAHTILADHIYFMNFVLFVMLLIRLIYYCPRLPLKQTYAAKNCFRTSRINSITCLRGLTYLITVFAILAVDFRSFPRYLAKTEKHGYSFMDTGVGLFVVMSGLVHKDLRNAGLFEIIRGNIKFILILFCLGFGRFVSVKHLEYHEHVSEYGVHWNFFFTLAVCKLISNIVLCYCPHPLLTSIAILFIHESLLHAGLEQWVFGDTPRITLLDANKEGLSSCLGYVSLYLFASYIKSVLCDKTVSRFRVQVRLILLCVILCSVAFIGNLQKPTSRTLANAGYCLYINALFVLILTVMYFLEIQFQSKDFQFKVPLILTAVNNNGLIYFLVSNILTGIVNLSMRTLTVPLNETLIILNLYMILTTALAVFLQTIGFNM